MLPWHPPTLCHALYKGAASPMADTFLSCKAGRPPSQLQLSFRRPRWPAWTWLFPCHPQSCGLTDSTLSTQPGAHTHTCVHLYARGCPAVSHGHRYKEFSLPSLPHLPFGNVTCTGQVFSNTDTLYLLQPTSMSVNRKTKLWNTHRKCTHLEEWGRSPCADMKTFLLLLLAKKGRL